MQTAKPTNQTLGVAKLLMAADVPTSGHSEAMMPAAFYVINRLRFLLAPLMGIGGFRALLSRAVVLAIADVPWLRALRVNPDGTLEELEALHSQLNPDEFLDGRVALVAQLLGLLVAFIGPSLTSRLICEVWPQMLLDGLDFGNGDQNEKAK